MILTVVITYECSMGCGYCFQRSERAFGLPPMRREDFILTLRWLGRANHREFKMTGGEPTQHPEFVAFCELAREAGLRIVLLTNGRFDFRALPHPDVLSGAFVHLRAGAAKAENSEARALASVELLQSAGVPVVLSCTISQPGDGLRDMIRLAGSLRKAALRIDLARSDLTRSNAFVPPDDYSLYKDMILDAVGFAASSGIVLNLDCPLPLCMFNEEDRNRLRASGLSGVCTPFPLVNPDLSVGCCPYPGLLQNGLIELRPDSLMRKLRNHPALEELRWARPPMSECEICPLWRARRCQGGCVRGKPVLPGEACYALPFRSVR